MEPIVVALVLVGAALVASMVSVECGVTVALIELGAGVGVGAVLDPGPQPWLDFLAAFASVVLTFLAGLEIDPSELRRNLVASVSIGGASFAGPFVVGAVVAWGLLDWSARASLIAGTALSTTSLAVVYAVLVESGLNRTRIGQLLMCSTFVTDMGTVLALSAIFIHPNLWFGVFLAGSLALIAVLPRVAPWFFSRYGDRVIEPEIKLVFVCLFAFMVLASKSHGHAVLPAFVLGLAMSRHFAEHRAEQRRLRVVAFAWLTPFFFLKGGMNVSLGALGAALGSISVLFAAKMVPKLACVWPLARRFAPDHAVFGTLLMSTGLTFGTISSLYGLNSGIIDREQFSLLVTVVVMSAVVPTVIAERWFKPSADIDREAVDVSPDEYV